MARRLGRRVGVEAVERVRQARVVPLPDRSPASRRSAAVPARRPLRRRCRPPDRAACTGIGRPRRGRRPADRPRGEASRGRGSGPLCKSSKDVSDGIVTRLIATDGNTDSRNSAAMTILKRRGTVHLGRSTRTQSPMRRGRGRIRGRAASWSVSSRGPRPRFCPPTPYPHRRHASETEGREEPRCRLDRSRCSGPGSSATSTR